MDIKELRIGNLLNWNGCICPVVNIDEDGFVVADLNQEKLNSNYHYFPEEVIVVWKLTEEWFERFGLNLYNFSNDYGSDTLEKIVVGQYNGEGDYLYMLAYHWDDYSCCNYDTKEIKYVHQLQNLHYVLTGKELTLKD